MSLNPFAMSLMILASGCSVLFAPDGPNDRDDDIGADADPNAPDAGTSTDADPSAPDGAPNECDPFGPLPCAAASVCTPSFSSAQGHQCVSSPTIVSFCDVAQNGGLGCEQGLYGYTPDQNTMPWRCLRLCDAAHPCSTGTCMVEDTNSNGVGICHQEYGGC